jgi:hypothetical protein
MNALRVVLPIVLGIAAAVLNFMVLRGSTAPLELTAVRLEVKAGTELNEDMLERVSVRADQQIFKSAVPHAERGLLLGRRVTRSLNAGEVVLYTDMHKLDEENISLYLKPGESTLTVPVKSSRIAKGLERGASVGILVAMRPAGGMKLPVSGSAPLARQMLGPFRLLSRGTPTDPSRSASLGDVQMAIVAVMRMSDGRLNPEVAALDEAIAATMSPGGGYEGGVLAIEYYQPAK